MSEQKTAPVEPTDNMLRAMSAQADYWQGMPWNLDVMRIVYQAALAAAPAAAPLLPIDEKGHPMTYWGGLKNAPLPLAAEQIRHFNRAALCIPDIQDKLCAMALCAIKLWDKLAELKRTDDITMAAFGALEKKFMDQVDRSEKAEAELARYEAEKNELRSIIDSMQVKLNCYEAAAKTGITFDCYAAKREVRK